MKLRSSPLKRTAELDETMTAVAATDTSLPDKEITLTLIEASLNELGEEQKVCVTLFYLEQQSYQQVSGVTGFSMLQVKSFIQNGKRNLKLIVERKLKQTNG